MRIDIVVLTLVACGSVVSGCSSSPRDCSVDCLPSNPPIAIVHTDGIALSVGDNFVLFVSDPAGSAPTSHACKVSSRGAGGPTCLQCDGFGTSCNDPLGISMRSTNTFALSAQDATGAPIGSQTFTPNVTHSDCCGDLVSYTPSSFTIR